MGSVTLHTHTTMGTTAYISLTVYDALPFALKGIPTPWTGKNCEDGVIYLLQNAKHVQIYTGENLQVDQPHFDRKSLRMVDNKKGPLIWVNRVTLLPPECILIEIEVSVLEKGIPYVEHTYKFIRKEQDLIRKCERTAGQQLFQKRKQCHGCM